MAKPANFEQAKFKPQSGPQKGTEIPVHFNPVSLEFTITNTLKEQGSGNKKKQYVSKSTGKLTMQLVFDTTHNGEDVRVTTEKIGKFMEPDAKKIPPIVLFEWGSYKFQGMVDSFKETIDFFAPNGVPLRATVSLSMSSQDEVFETTDGSRGFGTQRSPALDAVQLPPSPAPPPGGGGANPSEDTTGIATRVGDPRAGRGIAAANGLESMRFTAGAPLTVGPSVQLGSPVAFATGAAGGASAGAGIGISGGAGAGIA
ncbi:MAG TPA: hypothetical protein VFV34_01435, partial [Blastocatellia bacterium]|nr:hypothetical protein [Blastocatellia bacterium]